MNPFRPVIDIWPACPCGSPYVYALTASYDGLSWGWEKDCRCDPASLYSVLMTADGPYTGVPS